MADGTKNHESAAKVIAVIVSFNGGSRTIDLIDRLRGMVDCIYVVDNGSSTHSKELLLDQAKYDGVEIQFLTDNYGIGHALNLGIKYAKSRKFRWLLTLDQDSAPTACMVSRMIEFHAAHPEAICLSPQLVSEDCPDDARPTGEILTYAITSGNLIMVDILANIGGYNEAYFIDCVDFEFSLRIRRAGYKIFRVSNARMIHQVGDAVEVPSFLRKLYTKHSPSRRYYQHRNLIYLLKDYASFAPIFCFKLLIGQVIQFLIVIALENNRSENIKFIWRGLRDGFSGHGGRLLA